MANPSQAAEMAQVLDLRQVWFTDLLLLGFDPVAQEDKTKVRFCREMFVHINKKGMEVTLQYLFNRLDSHLAYEEFRDCWPVYDKKQEAQFRKACTNWLTKIAKEAPQSKLPRLSASILMSPGGDKFDMFMQRLTDHVLRIVCLREAKGEEKQVNISSFVTSPDTLYSSTRRHTALRALQCHTVRHTHSVARRLEQATTLHEQWRGFASDLVREYRSLAREKRQLETQIASLSPSHSHSSDGEGKGSVSTPTADKTRKTKMKKVRESWKSLEDFQARTVHEREVLGAIAKGNTNKYTIDAKDLKFQIPEMVLGVYEGLVREGKAGNTYEGGKLNLLSLLQLWNCALEVLRDRFVECDLPSFHAESEYVSDVLQAHRVNLAAAQNLRASLTEYQQSLRTSIEALEQELQTLRIASSEALEGEHRDGREERESQSEPGVPPPPQLHIPPITLPSLGLDLLPPSPQKSRDMSSPDLQRWQSHLSHLSLPHDTVSTPEAVHDISASIQRASRSQTPRHAHPHSHSLPSRPHPPPSQIPRGKRKTKEQETTVYGASLAGSVTPERASGSVKPTHGDRKSTQAMKSRTGHARKQLSSSRASGVQQTPTDGHTAAIGTGSSTAKMKMKSKYASEVPARSEVTPSQITPTHSRLLDAMPRAHDILAAQIASAVADSFQLDTSPHTPEQIHSLSDPDSALSTEAFVSHDKIPRTPISKPRRTQELSPLTAMIQQATPPHTCTAVTAPPISITASHCTPSPITTAHSTPSPITTAHSTPSPIATAHSTPSPIATAHFTPSPITTAHSSPPPVTTAHSTPSPVTTAHSSPPPVTTAHSTPSPVTTAHSSPPPVTTAHSSPPPVTTAHSTPPPVTTAHSTPSPITTAHSSPEDITVEQEPLLSISPPLHMLDSATEPASLHTHTPCSTLSCSLQPSASPSSFSTQPSFTAVTSTSSSVSHREDQSQLSAPESNRTPSSPLPILSSSLTPTGADTVATPTDALSTGLSTSLELLDLNSPTAKRLASPLVHVPQLRADLAHSPLLYSSPLSSTATLVTANVISGSPLQTAVGVATPVLTAPGRTLATPSQATGELIATTSNQITATVAASPHFAVIISQSTATTSPAALSPGQMPLTQSLAATSQSGLSLDATSERVSTTPANAVSTATEQVSITPANAVSTATELVSITPVNVVSDCFTTPTQTSSFLLSAQPPTPFLHADFDLQSSSAEDTSEEEAGETDEEEQQSTSSVTRGEGRERVSFEAGDGGESMKPALEDEVEVELDAPRGTECNSIALRPHVQLTASQLSQHNLTTSPSHPSPSPSAHITGGAPEHSQLIDFSSPDMKWRPLDVSGEHPSSAVPSLSPSAVPLSSGVLALHSPSENGRAPLNTSLKLAGLRHFSGSGEAGLFDEADSFLVPLSPQSSLSSYED